VSQLPCSSQSSTLVDEDDASELQAEKQTAPADTSTRLHKCVLQVFTRSI
jgi:hypothetical protein